MARSIVATAMQSDLGLGSVATEVNLAPLASAVVLFGLAQIWQRGVELGDEQRLTV